MSALGQKQTYAVQQGMSALPPKANMCGATSNVCFWGALGLKIPEAFLLRADEVDLMMIDDLALARGLLQYLGQSLRTRHPRQ